MINGNEAHADCPEKEVASIFERELDYWLLFFPSNTFKILTLFPTGAKYHQVNMAVNTSKWVLTPKINRGKKKTS